MYLFTANIKLFFRKIKQPFLKSNLARKIIIYPLCGMPTNAYFSFEELYFKGQRESSLLVFEK
jgi:hypothetical protein